MPNKYEIASYLVSLIAIMDSKEQAGLAKGNTITREYNRVYAQLMEMIQKEEKK